MPTSVWFCFGLLLLSPGWQVHGARRDLMVDLELEGHERKEDSARQSAVSLKVGGAKRLSRPQKVTWIRDALEEVKGFDDDEIADASKFVMLADDFIKGFGRVKSALRVSSSAGPFTHQVLGDITTGRQIGEGQWGQVYLSEAKDSVVKVDKGSSDLWKELLALSPQRTMDQLAHEAHIQSVAHEAGVSVPPILAVGAINTPGGSHDAIAMGLAGGKSLEDHPFAKLTSAAQHEAAKGIVFNLAKLLGVGIVNSDQGMQNIMVTAGGSVTFIDLGMARFRSELSPQGFDREAKKMVEFALRPVPPTAINRAMQDDTVSSALSTLPDDLRNIVLSSLNGR